MIKKIVFIILLLFYSSILCSQTLSIDDLSREGVRLGLIFNNATKVGDVEAQNKVLDDVDAILSTLKKQEQVDAFMNAFNNCNIEISTPENDAIMYVRALGNAQVARDEIGIEDAQDIITEVKNKYLALGDEKYQLFVKYFDVANKSLELGILQRNAYGDEVVINNVAMQLNNLRKEYSTDAASMKIIDDTYGYFSVVTTNLEYDAQQYAEKMVAAQKSGNIDHVNEVAKNIGYLYQRYYYEKGKSVADELNNKINQIVEQSFK